MVHVHEFSCTCRGDITNILKSDKDLMKYIVCSKKTKTKTKYITTCTYKLHVLLLFCQWRFIKYMYLHAAFSWKCMAI